MTPFKKAEPKQAKLSIGIYGTPGAGKSFTALLVAEGLAKREKKRIAYVDTERGTDFYCQPVPSRNPHPEAFDFDALYTRSLKDTTDAVRALDPKVYGVVVIDSISHLWQAAMDAYQGRKTKIDTIPLPAWSQIKRPFKELIRFLLDSPFHVFILGRQANVFDKDDASGELSKTGVRMRTEGETEYEPNIVCRMASVINQDAVVGKYHMYVEKDRTSVLAGRTIVNPNFATFEPILPLLGSLQAQSEDPDEVAARDAELIDDGEAKRAEKAEKSQGIYVDLNSKLAACVDLPALMAWGVEYKPAKRKLTEEHIESLKILYSDKHAKLSGKIAPAQV